MAIQRAKPRFNEVKNVSVTADKLDIGQIGGRRNMIINGSMQVAQRGTTTGMGDSNKYGACDRFQITSSGTNGRLTSTQDTDAPAGFATAYKLDCTTAVADADIASGALTRIRYRIEGQDIQQLQKGTSTAKKLTLTYYAKANVAGVYIIEAQDNGNNRISSVAHSITTSYQKFTHTFPADTTGTIANNTSTGFTISWYLHAGSDYKGGTLSSTFIAGVNANKGVGQTGNIFNTTDSTFFITGVQLEIGEQATPFEHRSFGEELALCQRYFTTSGIVLSNGTPNRYHNQINLGVTMRVQPTITVGAIDTGSGGMMAPNWDTSNANNSTKSFYQGNNNSAVASGRFNFDGEL